ncbi:MAG: ATP-binding cassette domain-containing protein [Muribaculaceae bacterium]|nr:ATP-binding cassette domain-containing protein [Muribaculaceae bacterium]
MIPTHIEEIILDSLLPRVFAREELPYSEVWRRKVSFRRGGRYLVESASGGGKSSLAAFIMGARRDYEGSLLFDGREASSLSIADWQAIRRGHIAYLPQELSLFPELSAIDNIRLKGEICGKVDMMRVEEWMERMGITARRDYPAGRLSIGQQQRVALIRSLCQPFDFILLDEPVSHLDEANNRLAAHIVEEEAERQGAAIITFSVGNPLLIENTEKLNL